MGFRLWGLGFREGFLEGLVRSIRVPLEGYIRVPLNGYMITRVPEGICRGLGGFGVKGFGGLRFKV